MTIITAQIINAFTDNGIGGNPAGVVFEAQRFTPVQKQQIAAKIGYSETAFVSPSKTADFKLEFFTPTKQIPHCGHATIATFSYLAQTGQIRKMRSSKETIEGNRNIVILEDTALMEQLAPRYEPIDRERVLKSLGITPDFLLADHQPLIVNTGNSFALVPLRDETSVINVHPHFSEIEQVSMDYHLVGYYVFSTQTRHRDRDAGARMFAPLYGINEESATGMAAGPLGCYLYQHLNIKHSHLVIEQGHLMTPASPSELLVELIVSGEKIESLMVGGRATVIREIEVEL
jgi:PhzF family phenazine biosynthesis protein